MDEAQIYVFCHDKITDYILEQLTRIRHTQVLAELTMDTVHIAPKCEHLEGIITSNRLDAIIACVCKISRSQASGLIQSGKVFVNNKEILRTTYESSPDELVSIRSVGRFRFLGCLGETRKGRLKIHYDKYI